MDRCRPVGVCSCCVLVCFRMDVGQTQYSSLHACEALLSSLLLCCVVYAACAHGASFMGATNGLVCDVALVCVCACVGRVVLRMWVQLSAQAYFIRCSCVFSLPSAR